VEINTVDAFQGSEKDIMVFNCVRSNNIKNEIGSLGFVTDERRVNVAITRARHFLVVVGNSKTLKKNYVWDGLFKYCLNGLDEQREASKQKSYFQISGESVDGL